MHTRHIRIHTLGVNEQPCATVVSDHSDPWSLCLALGGGEPAGGSPSMSKITYSIFGL